MFDLGVSDTDGLALFRQLRVRAETAAIKVVAFAARPGADLERKALAAGASLCLEKPLGGQELLGAVERVLGLR